MRTRSKLEKEFDKSPFSALLANKNRDKFLSIHFEYLFKDYCRDVNDFSFYFPIHNYLLDRYLGEKYSFLDGDVVVILRNPVTTQKKGKTKTFLMYSPEFWAMLGFKKEEFGKEYEEFFEKDIKKFSRNCSRRYPSIKDLSQGEKIRFTEVKYKFSSNTKKEEIPRIKNLLKKLLDDDAFISYIFDILLPFILVLQSEIFAIQKKEISDRQKDIKNFLSTYAK